MKKLLLCFLFTGCVQGTTVWEGGQRVLATNGDWAGMDITTKGGTHIKALTVTHSALITARGNAFAGVIGAAGSALKNGAIGGAVH